MAIISSYSKNLYTKFNQGTSLISFVLAMISTEIHDDYGHSRDFRFNSVMEY